MPGKYLGTANKVVKRLKEIIDNYWKGVISETQAKNQIIEVMSNPDNRIKVKRGEEYTGVFLNIMGKKRQIEFERLTASHGLNNEH